REKKVAEDDAASQAEASRQTKRYPTGNGLFSSSMFTTYHFHTRLYDEKHVETTFNFARETRRCLRCKLASCKQVERGCEIESNHMKPPDRLLASRLFSARGIAYEAKQCAVN